MGRLKVVILVHLASTSPISIYLPACGCSEKRPWLLQNSKPTALEASIAYSFMILSYIRANGRPTRQSETSCGGSGRAIARLTVWLSWYLSSFFRL